MNIEKTPWWVTAIIIVAMLPALVLPLSANTIPDSGTPRYLLWFYPAYVIATGVCAYITYPERRYLTWILLVLLLMSHAAMAILLNFEY